MRNRVIYPVLILLISFILFSLNNSRIQVFMLDEAKNATCAREMMERNDPVVPTFNGELRTDKPPLHYYFMMTSYRIFGFGEYAARFFSAVFGALTMLMVFAFTKHLLSHRTALWATLILLSSINFVFEFHLAVPDPYLIFFINAALFSFYMAMHAGRKAYLWGFYISLALGFLTKGPVAVALPALVILVFMIWTRQFTWKKLREMRLIEGILLFLLIAAPWYILVSLKTDMAWTEGFFLKHNLGRYTDTMQGHGGVYFLSVAYLLLGLLPFSVILVQSIFFGLRQWKHPLYLFLVLFILIFTLFFSLSDTQLPNYILPVYPACAILMAAFITQVKYEEYKKYRIQTSLWIGLLISLLLTVGLYIGVDHDPNLKGMYHLAYFLLPLPLGFLAALRGYRKKMMTQAWALLGTGFLLTNILLYAFMLPPVSKKSIAKTFVTQTKENQHLISYKRLNPSFVFYYHQPIPRYENLDELTRQLNRHPNTYLITRKKYKEELLQAFPELKPVMQQPDLFEGHTTLILSKSKR